MLSFSKSRHAGKILLQILFFLSSQILAQSPIISVSPESLTENLFTSKTSTQTLNISNTGNSVLTFNLSPKFSSGGTYQNYALQFDGIDDYINCGNNPSLNITKEITIGAWIYLDSLPDHYMIIVDKGEQWSLFIDENGHLCSDHQGISPARITSNYTFAPGVWYFVVDTYDGVTRKLFIDDFQDTFQVSTGSIYTDNGPFLIGTDSPWLYNFFQGKIDEVTIWNRALTEEEIKENIISVILGNKYIPDINPDNNKFLLNK